MDANLEPCAYFSKKVYFTLYRSLFYSKISETDPTLHKATTGFHKLCLFLLCGYGTHTLKCWKTHALNYIHNHRKDSGIERMKEGANHENTSVHQIRTRTCLILPCKSLIPAWNKSVRNTSNCTMITGNRKKKTQQHKNPTTFTKLDKWQKKYQYLTIRGSIRFMGCEINLQTTRNHN